MNHLLNVSSSPHARSSVLTRNLMWDVVIAMIPASVFGVYQFGWKALLVLIATVASCVLSEYVFERVTGRPITISDGSAVVTGMILGLNMPPEIPVWIPVLGGVCNRHRKTVIRWSWTELYEPGFGCQMLPSDLFCEPDVFLYLRWRINGNSVKLLEKGRECGCGSDVHR